MSKSVLDDTLPFASESKQKPPDYTSAFDAWKAAPGPQTNSALLKSVQPIMDRAIFTYAGAKPSPSLRSRAKMLTLQAARTYDPQKGDLKNHIMGQLRGLTRFAGQQNQIISIPERVSIDRRELIATEEELRDVLGRDPSDMEIADHTGMSLKRIAHIRRATPGISGGSMPMDEEGDHMIPASSIPGDNSRDDAIVDLIYQDLNNVDRAILDFSLGLRGVKRLDNRTIAARLRLSPGAISQRKAKIQRMLDEAGQLNILGG